MGTKYETSKDLWLIIYYITTSIAIILGGGFTLYKFEKLNEIEYQRNLLKLIDAKNKVKHNIEIFIECHNKSIDSIHYVVVDVKLSNTGNTTFHCLNGNSKLIVYQTDNIYDD